MSITMYGISNSGAGATGGLSFRAAILHVSAPFGSTVSISKGGIIAKSLGPERSHMNSNGESSEYYFSITPNNYGTWTITSTDGTNTASKTALITTNQQYDVQLTYLTYIYRAVSGICDLATDSSLWSRSVSDASRENAVFSNSGLLLSINDNQSSWTYKIAVQYALNNTITKLDFSNISMIRIYVDSVSITGQGVHGCIAISNTLVQGVSSSADATYVLIRNAVCDIASNPSSGYIDIDVSSYTGQYYLYVGWASGVTQLPSQTFNNSLTGTGTMNVTAIGYK